MELFWLFTSAFTSATILPGSSEVLLAALAPQNSHSMLALLFTATLGNTLGSLTTYGLGFLAQKRQSQDPFSDPKQQRAKAWLERWGLWALLLTWVPLIGDGLALLAGWLKLPLYRSAILMALGKAARYGVILWLTQQIPNL